MNKFTGSGSTITASTEDISVLSSLCEFKELKDDIMSHTNKGNEVDIDANIDQFGITRDIPIQLSIVAEKCRYEM